MITEFVMIDKTNFQPFLPTWLGASDYEVCLTSPGKRAAAARSTTSCGLSTSLTAEASLPRLSACRSTNHYKIVMFGKRFSARPSDAGAMVGVSLGRATQKWSS